MASIGGSSDFGASADRVGGEGKDPTDINRKRKKRSTLAGTSGDMDPGLKAGLLGIATPILRARGRNIPGGRKGPQTPVEANVGNLSGLGGFRDIIGEAIMGRRRKRGARSLAVGDTLAETTRKTLFGLL